MDTGTESCGFESSKKVRDEILSQTSTCLNTAPNTGREPGNLGVFFLILYQNKSVLMLKLTYNISWKINGVNRRVQKG